MERLANRLGIEGGRHSGVKHKTAANMGADGKGSSVWLLVLVKVIC